MAEPDTEAELREDLALARRPLPAPPPPRQARQLVGGGRYTCPSYEIARRGRRPHRRATSPFGVYDVITANLGPDVERRDPPDSVEEALDWSGTPLASKEVAVLCDITLEEAREQLGQAADEVHVGSTASGP